MSMLKALMERFRTDESGQGLVEYVLIIALIAIGLTAIMLVFRNSIGDTFNNVSQAAEQRAGERVRQLTQSYTGNGGGSVPPRTGNREV